MSDATLVEFLKPYAEALREGRNDLDSLREYAPFHSGVQMASGQSVVYDKNNNPFGGFSVRHYPSGLQIPWNSSMPVGPMDMAFANLFCEMANAVLLDKEPV